MITTDAQTLDLSVTNGTSSALNGCGSLYRIQIQGLKDKSLSISSFSDATWHHWTDGYHLGTLTQNIKTINRDGYYTTDSHDFFDWILENIDYDYSTKTIVVNDGTHRIIGYRGSLTSIVVPNLLKFENKLFKDSQVLRLTNDGTISGNSDLVNIDFSEVSTIGIKQSTQSILGKGSLKLNSVTFGAQTSINDYAFNQCTNLNSLLNTNNIISIGDAVFENTGLSGSIDFSGTKTLGIKSFYGCKLIESIIISTSLKIIPRSCFENCKKLKSLMIAQNVNSNNFDYIGDYAFKNCESLLEMTIKATSIGEEAFRNCSSVSIFKFLNAPKQVGRNAFLTNNASLQVYISDVNSYGRYKAVLDGKGFSHNIKMLAVEYGHNTFCAYYKRTEWKRLYTIYTRMVFKKRVVFEWVVNPYNGMVQPIPKAYYDDWAALVEYTGGEAYKVNYIEGEIQLDGGKRRCAYIILVEEGKSVSMRFVKSTGLAWKSKDRTFKNLSTNETWGGTFDGNPTKVNTLSNIQSSYEVWIDVSLEGSIQGQFVYDLWKFDS